MISIRQLEVGYKKGRHSSPIMRFPDISIGKGSFIAIAGPNGIGKSTLIKTLVQLIPSLEGEIYIKGKSISTYSRVELASIISYVSTEIIQASQVTVRDIVTFGRYPYTNWLGRITADDRKITDEAIELLELNHLADKFIDEISDGERQRAMIARAIAQQTDIIILDEPTAFLDLPHKHEIIHLLGKFSREYGKTILFTTHDLGIALREADKLWLLSENGFYEGAPEDLVLNGAISKVFNTLNVMFDNRKGEFIVKRVFKPYFHLVGKTSAVYWTRIALEKDGFTILDCENELAPKILIDQHPSGYQWMIDSGDKRDTFGSVSKLREFIRSNFSA